MALRLCRSWREKHSNASPAEKETTTSDFGLKFALFDVEVEGNARQQVTLNGDREHSGHR